MESVKPLVANCDFAEMTLAENQPEYTPLKVAVIFSNKGSIEKFQQTPMVARFILSDEERKAIADGGDISLVQLLCGSQYQPTSLQVLPKGVALDCADFK